jgi:hypothetical protein
MKYIWLALATLLTPIILVVAAAWLLYKPGPPIAGQELLAAYVTLHNRTTGESESVQSLVHSVRPGAFTPALSHVTYGDGKYFGTTYAVSGSQGDPASRPAPFPPIDVWCITLAAPNRQAHTILLAQHEDLYIGAWIIHEPTSESAAQALCR